MRLFRHRANGAGPAHYASAAELPYPCWVEPTADAALSELIDTSTKRAWPALRKVLARYRADDLTALIENLCRERMAELDGWLPVALTREREDPLARTVLGAHGIAKAWDLRTAKFAQQGSQEWMRTLYDGLRSAEQFLMDAAAIDPGDSAPRYFLLQSGHSLVWDLTELTHLFKLVVDRTPDHIGAHDQILQSLCEKWYGSHEAMFDFARAAMRGPYAEKLASLVAQAHIEQWAYRGRDEEAYREIRTDESRAELSQAAELTLFRSGQHDPRRPYKDANLYAAVFSLAEMWPEAWRAFEAADGVIDNSWVLVDRQNPYSAYVDARAKAFEHF